MSDIPNVVLHNGLKMPLLGFGVYQIRDLDECEQSVYNALMTGYRLIDTAASYGNEEAVGKAIKRSNIPREELFITSKLWIHDATYEGAKAAYQTSLQKLQLDYLDLYLIHQPYNDIFGAWRAMEEMYESGDIKAIGVSNFDPGRLTNLILFNKVAPMVNQIEIHPFNQQNAALEVMKKYSVQPEGWAPFAEGRQDIFTDKRLVGIAKKHGKSTAQVILRWNLQRGVVAIPKSVNKDRIEQNFNIFDFELTDDDINTIKSMDENSGLFVNHDDPAFIERLHDR
jgi:diketogulonate reductase-like aldo/keto reductase